MKKGFTTTKGFFRMSKLPGADFLLVYLWNTLNQQEEMGDV